MEPATYFSLQHNKSRVDSFDSVDSSFDVVSIGESIDECIEIEDNTDDEVLVEQAHDEPDGDGDWEALDAVMAEIDNAHVEIELDESFEDAIEAALEATIAGVGIVEAIAPEQAKPAASPRWRSAREALRDFYLSRAKTSEESSKHYRSYEPKPIAPPAVIAPLRAAHRYDVALYERVIREENERNAQQALSEFYAERDAAKAERAAANRANERFVYDSQIGSSGSSLASASSCTQSLYWETTRFVFSGNATAGAESARALST